MSPEGRRLLRRYLASQRVLSRTLERRLGQLWPLLITGPVSDTAEVWAEAVVGAVAVGHGRSSDLAAGFFRRFGQAEGVDVSPVRPSFDSARTRQLMLAAGPGLIRANLAKGLGFDDAATKARYWANTAAARESLSGGRETIRESSRDQALGWARATSGNACAFCAMLASRGPAFLSEETAEFESHVGCNCQPVPVFSRGQAWPDNSRRFQDEWAEAQRRAREDPEFASSDTDNDALNNFRRHLASGS